MIQYVVCDNAFFVYFEAEPPRMRIENIKNIRYIEHRQTSLLIQRKWR